MCSSWTNLDLYAPEKIGFQSKLLKNTNHLVRTLLNETEDNAMIWKSMALAQEYFHIITWVIAAWLLGQTSPSMNCSEGARDNLLCLYGNNVLTHYLSMLGLKFIHVSKRTLWRVNLAPWPSVSGEQPRSFFVVRCPVRTFCSVGGKLSHKIWPWWNMMRTDAF